MKFILLSVFSALAFIQATETLRINSNTHLGREEAMARKAERQAAREERRTERQARKAAR